MFEVQSQDFKTDPPLTVNRSNRADVINFFQTVYRASEGVPMGWTGVWDSCEAGANSPAYIDATLLRLNFFRVMAGLSGDVISSNVWNAKCQEAALLISKRGELSHNPAPDWPCYTPTAAEAAAKSLLSFLEGPSAVAGYIDDFGPANSAVLHRRRLLYPPQKFVGTGSLPFSNALWTADGAGPRSEQEPQWVAWPSAGYFPWPLLPFLSGRWSFTYSGEASLAEATVTMTSGGTNVPVNVEFRDRLYGRDMTIVWNPRDFPLTPPDEDITYTITISNVLVDLTYESFTYNVTVIDPVPTEVAFAEKGAWPSRPRNYPTRDVKLEGNLAYVADGPGGLRILDITDPSAPNLLSGFATPGSYASSVELREGFAFVTDGARGLLVADVRDATNPALVAVLNTGGFAETVILKGDRALVANGAAGLAIIDVRAPTAPVLIGKYTTTGYCRVLDITDDAQAYIIADDQVLEIVDVRDPQQPVLLSRTALGGRIENLRVVGTHAYLTDNSAGLRIIDVRDPKSPREVRDYSLGGPGRDMEVLGDYLFVAGTFGLQVLDIVNPVRPVLKGVYRMANPAARAVDVSGNYACVTDAERGVRIVQLTQGLLQSIDFSLPAEVTMDQSPLTLRAKASSGLPVTFAIVSGPASVDGNQLKLVEPGRVTVRAAQAGDENFLPAHVERTVLVLPALQTIQWLTPAADVLAFGQTHPLSAKASSGLAVDFRVETGPARIDGTNVVVTGPGTIRIIAEQGGSKLFRPARSIRSFNIPRVLTSRLGTWQAETGERIRALDAEGPYAYIALGEAGIAVLDVADPATPHIVGRIATATAAEAVRVVGNYIFVGESSRLTLFAIANATNLIKLSDLAMDAPVAALHVAPPLAFVACGERGLHIVDVSDPTAPKSLAQLRLPGFARDVVSTGNYAYVATESAGLQIVDVSNPAAPRIASNYGPNTPIFGVWTTGGKLAYIAGNESLQILETSEPARPDGIGVYRASGSMRQVRVSDNLAFLANDRTGFQVVDVSDPTTPIRVGTHGTAAHLVAFDMVGPRAYLAAENMVEIIGLTLRVPQSIDFVPPANVVVSASPLKLRATADSGLPVLFTIVGGDATLNNDELVLNGPGQIAIRAEQPGNEQFLPASVERLIKVSLTTPPRIGSLSYSNGSIRLLVQAAPFQDLVLEFSTDLRAWTVVAVTAASSDSAEFRLSSPLFARRGFYRVRVL